MGRWAQYDEDEYRLPEGMRRVGYDADTQIYTYQDDDGRFWEGPEGARYGELRPVLDRPVSPVGIHEANGDSEEFAPFLSNHDPTPPFKPRSPWRYLAPFLLIVLAFLLLVFRFIFYSGGSESALKCGELEIPYTIASGDTCWRIARTHEMTVEELQVINPRIDCHVLGIGSRICLKR